MAFKLKIQRKTMRYLHVPVWLHACCCMCKVVWKYFSLGVSHSFKPSSQYDSKCSCARCITFHPPHVFWNYFNLCKLKSMMHCGTGPCIHIENLAFLHMINLFVVLYRLITTNLKLKRRLLNFRSTTSNIDLKTFRSVGLYQLTECKNCSTNHKY